MGYGYAFTLMKVTDKLTALHSGNKTPFSFHEYEPVPLEELFNLKKPYATQNGNRSFSVLTKVAGKLLKFGPLTNQAPPGHHRIVCTRTDSVRQSIKVSEPIGRVSHW